MSHWKLQTLRLHEKEMVARKRDQQVEEVGLRKAERRGTGEGERWEESYGRSVQRPESVPSS